jgi:hypothetical protein
MKLLIIFSQIIFILAGLAHGAGIVLAQDTVRVDNLSESQVGQFPKDWKTYPFQKNKAKRVYKVGQNGGEKIIQALDDQDISVVIFKDFQWDIAQYPYLKFKWRAMQLPKGSREVKPETNDSACGVYVGFSRTHALKYVWSDSLPVGSYWDKSPGKYVIISKELGEKNKGKWQEVVVDVPKDHLQYFRKPNEKDPIGIGMLTDGNAVHQASACDYKDFYISKTP